MKEYEKVIAITYGTDDELSFKVGYLSCTKIEYHNPMGNGDRHYCDVYFKRSKVRIFNISSVEFVGGEKK